MLDDTIAAISTPLGVGGIGIVRISGPCAIDIADGIFKSHRDKTLKEADSHTIQYGHMYDPSTDQVIDEVLMMVMKSPHTYTKEDVVEVNCHGGIVAIQKTLSVILSQGARIAEPGEFTKRAFLNGRIDLSQAEAVIDIIKAKTEESLQSAVFQLDGSLSSKVKEFRHKVLEMIAHIEAAIDYPEHDIEEMTFQMMKEKTEVLLQELTDLIKTADTGKILREGLQTVIIGKPNVGKSSLMNALLREQRAIVTEIAGTTRDVLEEYLNIQGVPLKIIDTAGIRQTEDIVEKIGVSKSKEFLEKADLILMMLDASERLSLEDVEILQQIKDKKAIVLMNKTDLSSVLDMDEVLEIIGEKKVIPLSIIENKGLGALEATLKDMFFAGELTIGQDVMITNVRHKDALLRTKKSLLAVMETIAYRMPEDLISVDLQQAYAHLGEITGDSVGEDLIDQIFKQFCLGK